MNLAFPAALIILYVLPGIAFAKGYILSRRRATGLQAPDWSTLLAYGIAFSLPLHWLWIWLVTKLQLEVVASIRDALLLLIDKSGSESERIVSSIGLNSGHVTLYFLSSIGCAYPLGRMIGGFISALFKTPFFFKINKWDDIFSRGSLLSVAAVVERSSGTFIYVGIYHDRMIDDQGMLRGVWVTSPRRRPLEGDLPNNQHEEVFYNIETDILYISMDDVQTCSFSELRLQSVKLIEKIAYDVWQKKSAAGSNESKELNWLRAEKIFEHRLANAQGWRRWANKIPCVEKRTKRKEEDILTMAL